MSIDATAAAGQGQQARGKESERVEQSERADGHGRGSPLARATHTHTTHDDTTGPERGDCMLVGGCCGETLTGLITYSRQLSQARPRTASTSLTLPLLHEAGSTL